MTQKKEGRFHYDIFAFRGSFLELMVQSKDVLSSRDMPKCVIHMPGFNEQEIKETPVLEAYKAGQRWRVSLETMIREAAQGRLTENQIQHLLSNNPLNLLQADDFISKAADIPQEIKQLLSRYGEDGFVLEFIKHPDKINKELCLPSEQCFPLLLEYFEKLVGLDRQWQQDWNLNQVDYSHPNDQADLLVAYLMAMEFVHDLSTDPGSERLKRLKKKQNEYVKKSTMLLGEMRKNDPTRYIKCAEQVEANLTPVECAHKPEELGLLDTFRFEADSFLKEAMTLLTQGKLKENKYENVIITSDHGFIQGDESLETGKAPKLECVTRRYAYGTERNSENLYSVGLNQLNYATTESDYFIFERSTHLLNNQSQTRFYHGGNTLQERIVPVISFSLTKELPDNSGTFDFTIQTKTDTLGFHRISISVKSMQKKMFSPPQVEVQLISEPDIRVEIGDIVGAEHKGDIITLPLDQDSEIYFKLFNGAHSKAKIYLKSTQKATILKNNESADYFNVENYDPQHQLEKPQKRKQKDKPGATAYSDTIPSEFHAALTHLEKHGSLTEKFLVNTLGNNGIAQRKSRRFANRIAEWSNVLPFDIYIEQTAEGKEYRKK
jgi:hypothetical protein